jgi:uncharacterized Zn finger protein
MAFLNTSGDGTDFTDLLGGDVVDAMRPTNCIVYNPDTKNISTETTCPDAKGVCKHKLG